MIRPRRELSDYIQVYDNVLPAKLCKELVKKFDSNPGSRNRVENRGYPNFTHSDLTANLSTYGEKTQQLLMDACFDTLERYVKDLGLQFQFPHRFAYENFRIKKYDTTGHDRFDDHVDVGNHDSARRFLAYFFYLNDVEEGGETVFTDVNKVVQPKQGRCVVFPPTWTFPHAGLPPVSGPKYIIGGYLHYLSESEMDYDGNDESNN
jgi:hypothetical protein